MRRVLHLHSILSKIHKSILIISKTSDKPRIYSAGYLTSTPRDCQGHEKQRKTKKLSQIGGDSETLQLMPCGTLDWLLKQKENINGKFDEIQRKAGADW